MSSLVCIMTIEDELELVQFILERDGILLPQYQHVSVADVADLTRIHSREDYLKYRSDPGDLAMFLAIRSSWSKIAVSPEVSGRITILPSPNDAMSMMGCRHRQGCIEAGSVSFVSDSIKDGWARSLYRSVARWIRKVGFKTNWMAGPAAGQLVPRTYFLPGAVGFWKEGRDVSFFGGHSRSMLGPKDP